MRCRKENIKEAVVKRSMSYGGLSFDDTADTNIDTGDIDKYIDEAFQWLNSTIVSITAKGADTDNAVKKLKSVAPVAPLVLQVSMGDDDHLPSGDPFARLPPIP
ncbi:unnamed protein product [Diatraea saccharalis]|uniref:Uncharacterized protein n=1 Tax=Diatraea saccharalis TaxID=40085 RepID=A0A9N9WH42_9NEOP|nr:unnamed protein product [Diatraea saccharalis]